MLNSKILAHKTNNLEEVMDERLLHPRCIEGEGTCPPEDVGGLHGFEEFKEILKDNDHPEKESYIEWYGSEFYPNELGLEEINKQLVNLKEYITEIEND